MLGQRKVHDREIELLDLDKRFGLEKEISAVLNRGAPYPLVSSRGTQYGSGR